MSERTPERVDPVWLSRVLGVLAVALLILWWVLHFTTDLPWWLSALLLAGSLIAAAEGYRMARRAGEWR